MSAAALPQTARHAPAPGVSSPEREFLDCTGAVPLTIGDSVWNNNGDWPANVTQYGFPCYSPSQSLLGGEVVYEITIDGPECRAFGAAIPTSSCTHILYLLESCDEFDCLVSGTESIVTGCLDPGTYYLVVDGWVCYFELDTYDWTPVSHCCPILDACYTFDFSESNPGYTTLACDGAPVWEWGEPDAIPPVDCGDDPIVNVLGTNLDGAYPNNAGQVAIIGPIDITVDCACMELCHYYEIEEELDGGNVKVSTDGGSTWELLLPASAYDEIAARANNEGPRCVASEPVFSSTDLPGFVWDCFDLSAYVGESIHIGFFFGSGASTQEYGWYIKSVRIGDPDSPVQPRSWGSIKALYR
jgi:hypothetical protein